MKRTLVSRLHRLKKAGKEIKAFNELDCKLDKLSLRDNDIVLFKVEGGATLNAEMLQAFADHCGSHPRNLRGLMFYVLGPNDSLESIPESVFFEMARVKGFAPASTQYWSGRWQGRQDTVDVVAKLIDDQPELSGSQVLRLLKEVLQTAKEQFNAGSVQSAKESDCNSGASPREALPEEPKVALDEPISVTRLREHLRERSPREEVQGFRANDEILELPPPTAPPSLGLKEA